MHSFGVWLSKSTLFALAEPLCSCLVICKSRTSGKLLWKRRKKSKKTEGDANFSTNPYFWKSTEKTLCVEAKTAGKEVKTV